MTAKNTEYTPGPWSIDEDTENDIVAYDELLATVYPMKRDGVFESWKGNARLIAAAPEMLESLKRFIDMMEKGAPSQFWEELENNVRQVIRLAEEGR